MTTSTGADLPAAGTAYVEVHVTTPDAVTALHLAHALVEQRLAACAQVVPGVTSVYRWGDAVETADEHLLLVKSTADRFGAIRDLVRSEHPYDTPELLAVPVVEIDARYAGWLASAVGPHGDVGPRQDTSEDRL